MRNRIAWLAAATLALSVGLAACASSPSPDEPPTQVTSSDDGSTQADNVPTRGSAAGSNVSVDDDLPADSILTFDADEGSAQLVADMREGLLPVSCTVLYDQMGSLPSVTVTEADTIREVYQRLARMQVGGESNTSITDSYHSVFFELQDGTKVGFSFEGEGLLVRGQQNYSVLDRGDLWTYVRHLQDQYLNDEKPGDDWPAIELMDDEDLVMQCPTSAPAGETVQVRLYALLGAYPHVAVNGDEDYGRLTAQSYEFVMPDEPVTVHVWSSADGDPGS